MAAASARELFHQLVKWRALLKKPNDAPRTTENEILPALSRTGLCGAVRRSPLRRRTWRHRERPALVYVHWTGTPVASDTIDSARSLGSGAWASVPSHTNLPGAACFMTRSFPGGDTTNESYRIKVE